MMTSLHRTLSGLVAVLALVATFTGQGPQTTDAKTGEPVRLRMEPWPKEVLAAASRIPVQEGGRIKPLDTLAGFQMLRLNGKRSFVTPWDEKLTPIEWMLDCMFFSDQAWDYKIVLVDDTKAVEAIGVSVDGKNRRDRFSMRELNPGLEKLMDLAKAYRAKENDQRTSLESQTITLSNVTLELRLVLGAMDFAHSRFKVGGIKELEPHFKDRADVGFLEFADQFSKLAPDLEKLPQDKLAPELMEMLNRVYMIRYLSQYLVCMPPTDPGAEAYLAPVTVIQSILSGDKPDPRQLEIVHDLAKLRADVGDMSKFSTDFVAFSDKLVKRATDRKEFDKIDTEVAFYKSDWFSRGQYAFLFGFLIVIVLWFKPGLKLVHGFGWAASLIGVGMLITGIVLRCIIRDRPPITTPYEAILTILAVGVGVLLFIEYTRRTGLFLMFSTVAGALGISLANWHEEVEGTDTMQPLVAVLDTNFWLSTHVTIVTLGYCAGILAALVAHLYIFGKLLRYRRTDTKFYSDLSRVMYGILCFGLLFSTVGTILGGVWANDSWGRFWGWDPKENGALMLVLGYLTVLHARMGGYVREFGIALSSVFIGIIVMWAFWGVNLYQIGLHSYGFTETKASATRLYYWVEYIVLGLGGIAWMIDRNRRR